MSRDTQCLMLVTIIILFIGFSNETHAQQKTVSGTVVAQESGELLPGVNIVVKGSQYGTTTNAEGYYELSVSPTDTLVFTFIGYRRQEVYVGSKTVIDVEIGKETQRFDEMVVTALGVEKEKRSLGYSTQQVSGEDLTENQSLNLAGSLKGKVSGVSITQSPTPGGSSGIVIRGANSLTGSNQPLIVVDGVPIDNQKLGGSSYYSGKDYGAGFGDINPNNIEEMNVLKGPNASALYGARAANGAIVITTKSGRDREGVGVSFNSNVVSSSFMDFPTFQNRFANGYSPDIADWGTDTYNGQTYPVISGTPDAWGPLLDGTEVLLGGMKSMGPVQLLPRSEDNVEQFFNTGLSANNSIAVSGGDETTTYRVSYGRTDGRGTVPGNTYQKNNFNVRINTDVTDRLSVDGKANYIRSHSENRPELGISLDAILPNMLFMARYVNLDWLKDYRDDQGNYQNYQGGGAPYNPYWLINEATNQKTKNRLIGYVSATYDFTQWLKLDVRGGIDTYADSRHEQVSKGTPTSGYRNGFVQDNTWSASRISGDFLLTAERDLTQDINADVSLGGNYLHRETELNGNTGRQLSADGVFDISNAGDVNPNHYVSRKEIQSLYVMGNFSYRDYLYLGVTGRNDWSSTLSADNRSYFYPAVNASVVFTDAFNINSSILSFGKLRAAYAETGKDAAPYQINQGYGLSNNQINNGQRMGYIDGQIAPLNLVNELTKSYEFGANFQFFSNRIGLDLTYYNESTFNQIFPVNISTASGFNRRVINSGELENRGIETTLNLTPLQSNSFSWDMTLNYTKNNSKVVSLAEGVDTQLLQGGAGVVTIEARKGEPYGNIIGFPFKRNDAGRKVVTESGSPQRADERAVLGNIQPDWMGGLTNTFQFKGFELNTTIDVKWGGDMYSFSKYDQTAKGTGVFTEYRGFGPDQELVYPGVVANEDGSYSENTTDLSGQPFSYYAQHAWGNIGEFFVVDGSYVSLKEASLGYTFQPSFIDNTPFARLKLSVVARNILYLHRGADLAEMGLTPEGFSSRTAYAKGYEARNMPLPRTIGFNLNVKF